MEESDQEESARELFALTTLDGAVSSGGTLAPEMEGAREIAADATRGLNERLEAYEDILATSKALKDTEGLSVLPASTAGLLALLERHKVETLPSDRCVAVITGRRS